MNVRVVGVYVNSSTGDCGHTPTQLMNGMRGGTYNNFRQMSTKKKYIFSDRYKQT